MARFAKSGTNWEGRAWTLAACLRVLASQIEALHPSRHAADGTVASKTHDANNPSSDHRPKPYSGKGTVRALDAGETTENDAFKMAEAIRVSRDPRVKYVIHEGRLFSSYASGGIPPFTWRTYTGPNPHGNHFHISTLEGQDNNQTAWKIGASVPAPTPPSGAITLQITRKVVKKGVNDTAKGQDVHQCQGLLHAHGYASTVGTVDGKFGDNTDKAVRAFQTAKKLKVDGVVGEATWKALEA